MFKVVKIIDERQIVINGGKENNLMIDDVLEIYEPGGEVIDPETGETLGNLDLIKARIAIKDSFPKMSICVNDDTETESIFMAANFTKTTRKRLNVDATEISGGLADDRKIKIGDFVRKS